MTWSVTVEFEHLVGEGELVNWLFFRFVACVLSVVVMIHNHCIAIRKLQSNFDGSNTDGSFTMANSNSFLSPYEILPIAQENKYLRKFSYLS